MGSARLSLGLFGAFELRVGGGPAVPLTRKAQWVLALLALRGGREVERTWLAGTLWPESNDSQGLYNLRRELSRLRDALGPEAERLRSATARTLSLDLGDAEVDALAFDAAIAAGGPAQLERAVALYRGPLLEPCTEEWANADRARYEQAYLRALRALAQAATAAGAPAGAARWLRLVVTADPFQESAWRELLSALAAAGDSAAVVQAYRDLRRLLRRELSADTDPQTDALYAALRRARRERAQGAPAAEAPKGPPRLPRPLTRLIGREAETRKLLAALSAARLVTLTGSGGVGKTRLAIHAAERFGESLDEGAWFVDLSALGDAALVVPTAAAALGVREQPGRPLRDTLIEWLGERRVLMVLDNCEHLVDACATLASELLGACGGLRILATSRQPLGIPGEHAFRVPSLELPGGEAPPEACASVELFLERARQAEPSLQAAPEAVATAAQICRRLDGIPLAIELAAARVRVLPVAAIAARLDSCFELLAGRNRAALPRHQTLRAAIDWSHALLETEEQTMLRRLSVFASGFALESAEAVAADGRLPPSGGALELVSQLVDKSLVILEPAPAPRFRLLETVRQYAWERLEASGELEQVRDRHLAHFVALAEQAEPFVFGGNADAGWLGRLEAELDNLRAACDWAGRGPGRADSALRIVAALHWFWFASGRLREGRARSAAALSLDAQPSLSRAKALVASSLLQVWMGEAAGPAATREALPILREAGPARAIAYALCVAGAAATSRGDLAVARAALDEAIALARRDDAPALVPLVLWWLGLVAQAQGDVAVARASFEEGLALGRQGRWDPAIAHIGYMLGRLELSLGNHDRASTLYRESLERLHRMGDRWGIGNALDGLARLWARLGQAERAALLDGAAAGVRETIGAALMLPDRSDAQQAMELARTALGEARFDALRAEGRALPLDRAIEVALGRDRA